MSNETNNIDELFRGKLRDFSVDAPDHVWKGIEASRTPLHRAINYFKSKKGAALGSFILLAAVGSIAYFMGTSSNQLSQQNATASSIQRYNSPTSIQAANLNDVGSMQTSTYTNGNSPSDNIISVNTNAVDATSSTTGNTSNGDDKGSTQKSGSNTDNNSTSQPEKDNNADKGGITISPKATPTTNDENPELGTTPKQKDTKDKQNLLTKDETKQPTAKEDKTTKDDEVLTADALPAKGDGIDKSDKEAGQSSQNVEPETNFNGISVDVYAGGNYTMRSLSNNGVDNNYFDAKRDAESYRPGIVLGARLNYDVKELFTLRVGAQYTRFSQRINLNREYQYTTTETTMGIILDPVTQQPIDTVTRTETVEKTETAKANTTNTISFLDIPVQIEFDVYSTEKLSVFATTGAALNLRFTQKGFQINERVTGVNEISSANNPFNTTTGISILAGMGIKYNLNQRYSLLFETNYQHGISNVMKNNAGMRQSYRTITGSVGLRYRF